MATKTSNYQLTKPLASEKYDVGVQNANMDIIDIEMKANADLAASKQDKLNAGSGLSITGTTINHTNAINAGSVGGETAIPVIEVDGQGHVKTKSSKTVYPPTTAGTSGQYWKSKGSGAGSWQSPDTTVTAGSANLVTSGAVKTAIDEAKPTIDGAASTIVDNNLTASKALISDGNGKVATSAVTSTELGYLSGLTGNAQTQIDGKQDPVQAGTGISVGDDGKTIGHSNAVTAQTSYVGSATAIPRIKFDAQGHITGVTTTTVYPPTSVGAAGQVWCSDGSGAGTWKNYITVSTAEPTSSDGSNGDFWAVYE